MVSNKVAAVALLVLGAACSPSHDRFENAPEVVEVLRDAGFTCLYTPGGMAPVIEPPEGESWGHCNLGWNGATIHVLGERDALQQLKERPAGNIEDAPRIYWVYGENWWVATRNQSVLEQVHDALGGEIADNTQF